MADLGTALWAGIVLGYAVTAVAVGGLCLYVAEEKGRSAWSWFFLGLLLGIFALIAIAGTPARATKADRA